MRSGARAKRVAAGSAGAPFAFQTQCGSSRRFRIALRVRISGILLRVYPIDLGRGTPWNGREWIWRGGRAKTNTPERGAARSLGPRRRKPEKRQLTGSIVLRLDGGREKQLDGTSNGQKRASQD